MHGHNIVLLYVWHYAILLNNHNGVHVILTRGPQLSRHLYQQSVVLSQFLFSSCVFPKRNQICLFFRGPLHYWDYRLHVSKIQDMKGLYMVLMFEPLTSGGDFGQDNVNRSNVQMMNALTIIYNVTVINVNNEIQHELSYCKLQSTLICHHNRYWVPYGRDIFIIII